MEGIWTALIFATLLLSAMETCSGYGYSYTYNDRDSYPVVTTSAGDISGKKMNIEGNDVTAFLGIPYAEPPVGDQRFKKSVRKRSWSGVYDATKKPPPCMQFRTKDFPWIPKNTPSEDCLYLNVWVPGKMKSFELESRCKPVLLWIYGGGYFSGSTDIDVYDGAVLAAQERVIVVSVNYRVGSFGFLASGTPEASGNMGLYDQYLAMEWVKNNIRNFNGDPDKITLFGQSAGAVSVGAHLVSPLSRNLFKRAIMESGGPYHPLASGNPSVMIYISNLFATAARCANDTVNIFTDPQNVIQCLRTADARQLATIESVMLEKSPFLFLPIHGDDLLPVDMITAMNNGDFKHTELLLGTNADEGSVFLLYILPDLFKSQLPPKLDKKQAEMVITGFFQNSTNPPPQVVSGFYLKDVGDTDSSAITKAVYDSYGDNVISCPTVLFAEKFSKGGEAFFYQFNHRPSNTKWGKWMGVTHFEEVPFVFGDPIRNSTYYTAEERIFSRAIMRRWATFARTGVPIVSKTEGWPKFTESRPLYVELNPKRMRIGEHPHKKGCDFWRSYFVPS